MIPRLSLLLLASALLSAQTVPQVAFGSAGGGAWQTTVILVNRSATAGGVIHFHFFQSDGQPMPAPIEGVLLSTHRLAIAPNGSRRLVIADDSAPLTQGWLRIIMPPNVALSGQAILRQRVPGRPDFETAVPLSAMPDAVRCLVPLPGYMAPPGWIFPFDNTPGFVTTIALVNTSGIPRLISLEATDEEGRFMGGVQFEMQPGRHLAFRLEDRLPMLAGQRGTFRLPSTRSEVGVVVFLFNDSGPFATLLPIEP